MQITKETKMIISLVLAGIIIGIGKVLASAEAVPLKQAMGRAILSGGLGLCAGALTLLYPNLSFTTVVGIACVLASLGSDALQSILVRVLK